MQLTRTARRLLATGTVAAGAISGIALTTMNATPASAGTLPAYTADGFCSTSVINAGSPKIEGKTCTGLYKVTKATYKFTEDNIKACPAMGVMVHLDEKWISPPTGGAPTVLASYHAYV